MKTSVFLSLALTANAVKFVSGPEGWPQALGFKLREKSWDDIEQPKIGRRGVLAAPRQDLKPRYNIPGAKTVKLRYGPYTVPAPPKAGGEGMVWNKPTSSVTKPCSNCHIIGMNAGLEYADGTDANTDTMMWLHHMVLFNIGSNAWDASCTVFGLPHMIVGSLPATSERIFSSGNERTIGFFQNPQAANITKVGYPVWAADRFGLIADLMNMNPQSKQVWMTMYYDYVEGTQGKADWADIKPVWLDVAQCGTSEVGGGRDGTNFKISALPWSANFDGDIMAIGGHVHDGAVKMDVTVNGKKACEPTPYYGPSSEARARANLVMKGGVPSAPDTSGKGGGMAGMAMPAGKSGGGGGMAGHAGGQHIVAMSVCSPDTVKSFNGSPQSPLMEKKVVKGQSWGLNAWYDYKEHAGMKSNSGGMDSVMGISIMFVKNTKKRG